MLAVVREQPQHHLQAAEAGAQERGFGFGSMTLAGSFAGILSRAAAAASFVRAAVFFCAAGISLVFLAAGVMAGSASSAASSRSAVASIFSVSRTVAVAFFSSAGASDRVTVSSDGSPVTKHTAARHGR